jgi:uncharacterized protein YbjT (DUF2867 family)
MRVVVIGASGFIASRIVPELLSRGHAVTCLGRSPDRLRRRFPGCEAAPASLGTDGVEIWHRRLSGVDAVINAAGILRGDLETIHYRGPAALFDACARARVPRLVQISALGAGTQPGSHFLATKDAADRHLLRTARDSGLHGWCVLRPSLVIGRGGGSTALFCALAAFIRPVRLGPGNWRTQPIHVADLARIVAAMIEAPAIPPVPHAADPNAAGPGAAGPDAADLGAVVLDVVGANVAGPNVGGPGVAGPNVVGPGGAGPNAAVLDVVGPEPMTTAQLVAALRGWLGLPPRPFVTLPLTLIRAGAGIGALLPNAPLTGESLAMLARGNTADATRLATALGWMPRRLSDALAAEPAVPADLWFARMLPVRPVLTVALLAVWFGASAVSFAITPERAQALLSRLALDRSTAMAVTWGGAVLDLALGLALLPRSWRRPVLLGQLGVMLLYTGLASVVLPELWADPFGGLVKNVAVLAATLALLAVED